MKGVIDYRDIFGSVRALILDGGVVSQEEQKKIKKQQEEQYDKFRESHKDLINDYAEYPHQLSSYSTEWFCIKDDMDAFEECYKNSNRVLSDFVKHIRHCKQQ